MVVRSPLSYIYIASPLYHPPTIIFPCTRLLCRALHRRSNANHSQLSSATAGGARHDNIEVHPHRDASGWNTDLTVASEDAPDQNRRPRSPPHDINHHHGGTDGPNKAPVTDNFNSRKQLSVGESKSRRLHPPSKKIEATNGLKISRVGGKNDNDNSRDIARSPKGGEVMLR